MRTSVVTVVLVVLATAVVGCAERKMTVISDPPGATVYMDGVEKGVTPVTYKFNWYGGRRFVLKRDGYETCEEVRSISPPLHMRFPLDTVWDLTPLPAKDNKTLEFKLVEEGTPKAEELRERAEEMRARAYKDTQLKLKAPEGKVGQETGAPAKTPGGTEVKPEQPVTAPGSSEPPAEKPGSGTNH